MYNVSNLQVKYLRIAEQSKAYNPAGGPPSPPPPPPPPAAAERRPKPTAPPAPPPNKKKAPRARVVEGPGRPVLLEMDLSEARLDRDRA